jgi:repressor LexA
MDEMVSLVEIDRVLIDDIPHRVVNLRDGGQARLAFAQNYFVIQVTGDSMNRASLEEGDYALVKVQEQAADQDIVLAEIAGVDGVIATLKRFVRQGKQIILKPDSTNPRHSPLPFSSNDQELKIRGVVLAVFKRI